MEQRDSRTDAAPVNRQAFEAYMLNREHPVIGWIDERWFKRGDHPDTYANDYVQGAWVLWQDRLATEQAPVAWAPIARGGLLDIMACRRSRPSEAGWAPLFDRASNQPELTVWYGPMPESNGKSNFTAILMRKGASLFDGLTGGITIARSEYPDRVRYEADRVRYLIGELKEEPDILDYDAEKHSGYQDATHAAG
jgi:hypothetical protein